MLTPKTPYTNLSSAQAGTGIRKVADKLGRGIERFGRVIAKPMAKDEAEQARAEAAANRDAEKKTKQTTKRANDTRWKNKQHKDTLNRNQQLADQRLENQKKLDTQRTDAAVERAKKIAEAKNAGNPATTAKTGTGNKKTVAKTPVTGTKAPKTGKDNLLEPVAPSSPKKPSTTKRPVVDTKAGDLYND